MHTNSKDDIADMLGFANEHYDFRDLKISNPWFGREHETLRQIYSTPLFPIHNDIKSAIDFTGYVRVIFLSSSGKLFSVSKTGRKSSEYATNEIAMRAMFQLEESVELLEMILPAILEWRIEQNNQPVSSKI